MSPAISNYYKGCEEKEGDENGKMQGSGGDRTPPVAQSPPVTAPVVVNFDKFSDFVKKQTEDALRNWKELGYIPPGKYREFLAGFEGPMIPFIKEGSENVQQ